MIRPIRVSCYSINFSLEESKVLVAIANEYYKTSRKFKPFKSSHEGFAVLKEEVDELWDQVKRNDKERAYKECVQVAAMTFRFLVDCPPMTKEYTHEPNLHDRGLDNNHPGGHGDYDLGGNV